MLSKKAARERQTRTMCPDRFCQTGQNCLEKWQAWVLLWPHKLLLMNGSKARIDGELAAPFGDKCPAHMTVLSISPYQQNTSPVHIAINIPS